MSIEARVVTHVTVEKMPMDRGDIAITEYTKQSYPGSYSESCKQIISEYVQPVLITHKGKKIRIGFSKQVERDLGFPLTDILEQNEKLLNGYIAKLRNEELRTKKLTEVFDRFYRANIWQRLVYFFTGWVD